MRAAYCALTREVSWDICLTWGPMRTWLQALGVLIIGMFVTWVIGRLVLHESLRELVRKRCVFCHLRCCRRSLGKDCPSLFVRGLGAVLTRTVVISAVIVMLLTGIMFSYLHDHEDQRKSMCRSYIQTFSTHPECSDCLRLGNEEWGPWWKDPIFKDYWADPATTTRMGFGADRVVPTLASSQRRMVFQSLKPFGTPDVAPLNDPSKPSKSQDAWAMN
jgi:hypothetical protein